eukprot:15456235-Alexandrium_andersonii.AAC.2
MDFDLDDAEVVAESEPADDVDAAMVDLVVEVSDDEDALVPAFYDDVEDECGPPLEVPKVDG